MFLFASLFGMLAIGSVAFINLGGDDDLPPQNAEDAVEDAPEDLPEPELTTDLFPDTAEADPTDPTDPTGAPDSAPAEDTPPQPGQYDMDQGMLPQDSLAVLDDPDETENDWTIDTGGEIGDTLTGTDGSDFLLGYGGNDLVDGGGGDDQVEGGAGDDTLSGGEGDDILHGQNGHDLLQGDDGDDDLYGHDGDDTLNGGTGADSLVGGQGDDVLNGGADGDALHGYHGDDTLTGDGGADTLFGGVGADVISGLMADGTDDDAVDYLNGGDGDDQITAGTGDIVSVGDGEDTVRLAGHVDVGGPAEIMDFTVGEDSIVIEYDPAGTTPDIGVTQDDPDDDTYRVLMDGVEVAVVHSTSGFTAGDVALVPQGVL